MIKKITATLAWLVPAGVFVAGVIWVAALPKIPQSTVVSSNGIHWHSHISITIKGEQVEIPTGIGIGAVHNPMHTHEADGTIHLEYGGVVKENDLRLGNFFTVWGKDFSATSIMGNKSGEGGTVRMLVNGAENTEFENYLMKDGDKMEIIYE